MASDEDNFVEYLASILTSFPEPAVFKREQGNDKTLDSLFSLADASKPMSRFCVLHELLSKKNYSAVGSRLLLVVPRSLRSAVLSFVHDDVTSGHMGLARTLHRAQQRFYWPNMRKTIERYVATCTQCQRYKNPTTAAAGRLQPVDPPRRPFQQVGIDLLGPFPRSSHRNRWIIVCVDYLSRYAETAALPSATATEVTFFLLRYILLRHGPPQVIISERGRQFTANVVEELLRLCSVQFRHATPYHPQTNGLTERTNRTLASLLVIYVCQLGPQELGRSSSVYHIPVQYCEARNNRLHPFFVLYARQPGSSLDTIFPFFKHDDPSLARTLCLAEEARLLARLRILASQKRSKQCYESRRRDVTYAPGDLVRLWTPLCKRGLCEKFLAHYVVHLSY